MKAEDKIIIGGITLKAEPHELGHICESCYFYGFGECSALGIEKPNRPKCWDDKGNNLIFKEEK